MNTRTCNKCGIEKPYSEFAKSNSRKLGIQYTCKQCNSDRAKLWYFNNKSRAKENAKRWVKNNREKAKQYAKERLRKHHYGMEYGEYDKMFAAQSGKCYLCNRKTKLEVDHCHKTGCVRKLLCRRCNLFVGWIESNMNLLDSAIRYINDMV